MLPPLPPDRSLCSRLTLFEGDRVRLFRLWYISSSSETLLIRSRSFTIPTRICIYLRPLGRSTGVVIKSTFGRHIKIQLSSQRFNLSTCTNSATCTIAPCFWPAVSSFNCSNEQSNSFESSPSPNYLELMIDLSYGVQVVPVWGRISSSMKLTYLSTFLVFPHVKINVQIRGWKENWKWIGHLKKTENHQNQMCHWRREYGMRNKWEETITNPK